MSLRVERGLSKDTHIAASKALFGRMVNDDDCLPVGTQVLEQQCFGIVNDNDVVGDKRQRKCSQVESLFHRGRTRACANTLLEMPRDVFKSEFCEIIEAVKKEDQISRRKRVRC